jgi:hypothetical protein
VLVELKALLIPLSHLRVRVVDKALRVVEVELAAAVGLDKAVAVEIMVMG